MRQKGAIAGRPKSSASRGGIANGETASQAAAGGTERGRTEALERLVRQRERAVRVRAQAAALLKQRGPDVFELIAAK